MTIHSEPVVPATCGEKVAGIFRICPYCSSSRLGSGFTHQKCFACHQQWEKYGLDTERTETPLPTSGGGIPEMAGNCGFFHGLLAYGDCSQTGGACGPYDAPPPQDCPLRPLQPITALKGGGARAARLVMEEA